MEEEELTPETVRPEALVDPLPFFNRGSGRRVHVASLVPKEKKEIKKTDVAAEGYGMMGGGMMGSQMNSGGMMGSGGGAKRRRDEEAVAGGMSSGMGGRGMMGGGMMGGGMMGGGATSPGETTGRLKKKR